MDELLKEIRVINAGADYQKTLALLRALKAGLVSLDNVTMTGDGWSVAEVVKPEEVEAKPE